jgi:hypothetical protein
VLLGKAFDMRNSTTLTLVVLATLATASAAIGGLAVPSEEVVLQSVEGIREELSKAPKVLTTEPERYNGLSNTPLDVLRSIMKDLQDMSYTELYAIKLSESETCSLVSCRGVNAGTVRQLTDAVLSARDKDQSTRAANINSTISISGGILAVLSFIMSASSTIASIRSRKAG